MKKSTKRLISVLCVMLMVLGISMGALAENDIDLEGYQIKAKGRIEADVDKSGVAGDSESDFVYDADDIVTIAGMVKDGKTKISSSLNAYPTANVNTLDSFTNLSSSIDNLTAIPAGKFYYDSTTGTDDASELKRYIKENGTYYLCDQNGNKISDEAQTVDENNLVEYAPISEGNLTAGTAGMVDKSFILGNGADNITYRNNAIQSLVVTQIYNKTGTSWNSTDRRTVTLEPGTYYISYGVTKVSGDWGQNTSLTFNGVKINYSNYVGKTYTFVEETEVIGKCTTSSCKFTCTLVVLKLS